MCENQNPLYQLYTFLACHLFPIYCGKESYSLFCDERIPYLEFMKYLVFEAVAEDVRQMQQTQDTLPLHSIIKHSIENTPGATYQTDSEEELKKQSKELGLRLDFLSAEIQRHGLPEDSAILTEHQDMMKRNNRRKGYRITPIQFQQLTDKDDFFIKKVHELRRFISSKHAPNSDVIRYYDSLMKHAQDCSRAQAAMDRVISAINLNDFENKNLPIFLYYTARHCYEHNIKNIDTESEQNLIALSGALSDRENRYRLLSTHKPVLFLPQYLSAAFDHSSAEMTEIINIRLCGQQVIKQVLSGILCRTSYTYENIDQFACNPNGYNFYNIFTYYRIPNLPDGDSIWDEKGKIISILRKLIDKLTVDPLST